MGAASSCKSTGSPGKSLGTKCKREYSFPQRLLQLRHQMGLLKRCRTSPFSSASATLCLEIIPANALELGPPVCSQDWGDTMECLFPTAQHSPSTR